MNFNKAFRLEILTKIIAEAKFSESISKAIEQSNVKQIPNKPTYAIYDKQPFTIPVGNGSSVWVPINPIINGKYNVFIWVRPGNISANGVMKQTDTNSVVVTVDAGGAGSSENSKKYGNVDFLLNTLNVIDKEMNKHFGQVELGNVGLGAFSGGYDAVGCILNQLQKNPKYSSIYQKITAVMMLDNMHNDPGGAFKTYAQEAAKNNDKKFIAMYSQIRPGYKSSRQAAEELAQHVGAQKTKGSATTYGKINPNSVSSINGVKLIEAYPEEWTNQSGKDLRNQHIMISDAAPYLMNELADSWNS